MCWKREFDKIFHIINAQTNMKICDIHLNLVNNHSLWIDNTAGNMSAMSVKVDGHTAIQEGEMGTNCCGCAYNVIHENMAVKIKYDSIPQLFANHNVEWVLNLGPIFDKPYSRMHLYINGKNVLNQNETTDEYTNSDYKCGKCCAKFGVWMLMSIIFGCLYALIGMAFLGGLSWAFLAFWMVFGAATWHHILACTAKAVCESSNPGVPKEVTVTFDPSSGLVTNAEAIGVELVVGANNATNNAIVIQTNSTTNSTALPSGWSEVYTNDGKVYYQNDITKQTQWERPQVVIQQQNVSPIQQQIVVQQNLQQQPVEVVVKNNDEQPPTLPRGWTIMYTNDGKKYYQNDITKVTQWDLPTEEAIETKQIQQTQQDALPNGWKQVYTNDGRVYYQNDITKTTSWDRPTQ